MRYLPILIAFSMTMAACGCWSSSPADKPIDTVSEPGVTPPPPDPNKIVGNNPRDPKNRKEREVHPAGPLEPSTPKPAAENSEASAMMNEDGSITEFRVFKGHPQITKAEARWLDPTNKTLKVFLKNGKSLEAKTDRVPYLHTVPSSLLLEIVGVKPTKTSGDRPRIVDR